MNLIVAAAFGINYRGQIVAYGDRRDPREEVGHHMYHLVATRAYVLTPTPRRSRDPLILENPASGIEPTLMRSAGIGLRELA